MSGLESEFPFFELQSVVTDPPSRDAAHLLACATVRCRAPVTAGSQLLPSKLLFLFTLAATGPYILVAVRVVFNGDDDDNALMLFSAWNQSFRVIFFHLDEKSTLHAQIFPIRRLLEGRIVKSDSLLELFRYVFAAPCEEDLDRTHSSEAEGSK
ncbi:hypothetical protein F4810DRAFT_713841 [Camillea tinctor]|nr:hypothetical protein F4810DRAFT_713841 [Camillea tinctor]